MSLESLSMEWSRQHCPLLREQKLWSMFHICKHRVAAKKTLTDKDKEMVLLEIGMRCIYHTNVVQMSSTLPKVNAVDMEEYEKQRVDVIDQVHRLATFWKDKKHAPELRSLLLLVQKSKGVVMIQSVPLESTCHIYKEPLCKSTGVMLCICQKDALQTKLVTVHCRVAKVFHAFFNVTHQNKLWNTLLKNTILELMADRAKTYTYTAFKAAVYDILKSRRIFTSFLHGLQADYLTLLVFASQITNNNSSSRVG